MNESSQSDEVQAAWTLIMDNLAQHNSRDEFEKVAAAVKTIRAAMQQGAGVDAWQPIKTIPRNGNRIRILLDNKLEYDAWYEENLETFLGMDSEWNLLFLKPTAWRFLNE